MKPIMGELIKEIKEDQRKFRKTKTISKPLSGKYSTKKKKHHTIHLPTYWDKRSEIEEVKTKIQEQDRIDRILMLRITRILGNEDEVKLQLFALATKKLLVPPTCDDFHMQVLPCASAELSNQAKVTPTFVLKFNKLGDAMKCIIRGTNIHISENLDRDKQRLFYQCRLLKKTTCYRSSLEP